MTSTIEYRHPRGVSAIVSSVRAELRGNHAHVTVWSRGGCAGTLTVGILDAEALLALLVPPGDRLGAP